MAGEHLILIDASGIAHRSWHVDPGYRDTDGTPIGAILEFMRITWRLLGVARADQPTHGAAVFDTPGPNFRHALYAAYKGNRPDRDKELSKQLLVMRSAAEVLGLHSVEYPAVEADDTIATLAVRARKAGMRVTIVSSDKDMTQLVVDGEIEIYDPVKKRRLGEAEVITKMGVPPKMVQHVQALSGDETDNIIGVPGVGGERAAALVRRFGGIEAVLAHAGECRWPGVRRELLKGTWQERVRLNLKLTTLKRAVKLDVDPMALTMQPVMKSHLQAILKALDASHHMEAIFQLDPQASRLVPHEPKPWAWWEAAVKGLTLRTQLPIHPQAGFYQTKLVRGGPMVGAAIWREEEKDADGTPTGMDIVRCEIAGKARDPFAEWVRLSMYPIPRSEFKYREAAAAYDRLYRPESPRANPTKPIVLAAQPASRNPRPIRRKSS